MAQQQRIHLQCMRCTGDMGLIPGSERSPAEGNGNPFQCSCLGNPIDREAWWASVHEVPKDSDTTERLNNNNKGAVGLPSWLSSKESTCQCRRYFQSLGWEDPLEKEMATHSSILVWEVPRADKQGGLQFVGL